MHTPKSEYNSDLQTNINFGWTAGSRVTQLTSPATSGILAGMSRFLRVAGLYIPRVLLVNPMPMVWCLHGMLAVQDT